MARFSLAVLLLALAYVAGPQLVSIRDTTSVGPGNPGMRELPVSFQASSGLEVPLQEPATDMAAFSHLGARLVPRAVYHIEARVMSHERYYWDPSADLSPVDLLLGWGPMMDERFASRFDFSQSGRFGYWQWHEALPIPEKRVHDSLSNVHIIPASDEVDAAIKDVGAGELVRISGLLVDAYKPDGFVWKTSTRRTDRGAGACEILFATRVDRF
ncbi:MAG: hypothetical protein GY725_23725 [bacterium]|nr:hypothetical protein [bacterium]